MTLSAGVNPGLLVLSPAPGGDTAEFPSRRDITGKAPSAKSPAPEQAPGQGGPGGDRARGTRNYQPVSGIGLPTSEGKGTSAAPPTLWGDFQEALADAVKLPSHAVTVTTAPGARGNPRCVSLVAVTHRVDPPKQQPRHTWPGPLKSSKHNMSRKHGSPTLTGGLSLCPREGTLCPCFDGTARSFLKYCRVAAISQRPHRTPGDADTGTRGQSRTPARDSEKLGVPACGWEAVLWGPHGRGVQERSAGATHGVPPPQTHARADESRAVWGAQGTAG